MSDTGRQDFSDKVGAAVKPDSSKTTTEKMGDTVKGNTDKAAREVMPQGEKSNTQAAADNVGHGKDHHDHKHGEGAMGKVKDTLGLNKD